MSDILLDESLELLPARTQLSLLGVGGGGDGGDGGDADADAEGGDGGVNVAVLSGNSLWGDGGDQSADGGNADADADGGDGGDGGDDNRSESYEYSSWGDKHDDDC